MTETLIIHLTRSDRTQNMARFYRLELSTDLFGGVRLIRSWGRIGQQGQQCSRWFADRATAAAERDFWLAQKTRRGYRTP